MKITKRQLKRIIREEYSRLVNRGIISEGLSFHTPNGEPTQEEHAILDFFAKNTYEPENIPPELSQDNPDKVHTIGNLSSIYFDEGLPLENAIQISREGFSHTEEIRFLPMSAEDVEYAYSVFDNGGIY